MEEAVMRRSASVIGVAIPASICRCATKSYARQDFLPLKAKLNQIAYQPGKQGQELQQTPQNANFIIGVTLI
jgi:hypothetical protein